MRRTRPDSRRSFAAAHGAAAATDEPDETEGENDAMHGGLETQGGKDAGTETRRFLVVHARRHVSAPRQRFVRIWEKAATSGPRQAAASVST